MAEFIIERIKNNTDETINILNSNLRGLMNDLNAMNKKANNLMYNKGVEYALISRHLKMERQEIMMQINFITQQIKQLKIIS